MLVETLCDVRELGRNDVWTSLIKRKGTESSCSSGHLQDEADDVLHLTS